MSGGDPETGVFRVEEMLLEEMARPSDFGLAFAFLASETSRYMTGAAFLIDGGYTVR